MPASPTLPTPPAPPTSEGRPWYRIPAMWFVIGGPATAVVASITSAVLAIHGADRPLLEHLPAAESTQSTSPAMAARNHAATPRP